MPQTEVTGTAWKVTVVVTTAVLAAGAVAASLPGHVADRELRRALAAADQARLDDAEAHLTQAIAWTPGDADLHQMLGQVYVRMATFRPRRQGYLTRALAAYEAATRLNPHAAYPLILTGWAHLYLGDATAAEREFRRAEAFDPNNPYVHYSLGTAYLWQKKLGAARAELDVAQRYYADAPEVLTALREIERLETPR
jgi:tetratricopeptide (TPR) repeat protein